VQTIQGLSVGEEAWGLQPRSPKSISRNDFTRDGEVVHIREIVLHGLLDELSAASFHNLTRPFHEVLVGKAQLVDLEDYVRQNRLLELHEFAEELKHLRL